MTAQAIAALGRAPGASLVSTFWSQTHFPDPLASGLRAGRTRRQRFGVHALSPVRLALRPQGRRRTLLVGSGIRLAGALLIYLRAFTFG
jgi:hypothetical protein